MSSTVRSGTRPNLAFSSLDEIRTQSQAILGKEEKEKEKEKEKSAGLLDKAREKATEFLEKTKEKTTGILDKGKHSQEVVGLIEKLRNAIAYYQVSGDREV